MPRARKRHVQLELPKTKRPDKNGQLRGGSIARRRGTPGRRVGRPRSKTPHGRPWESHRARRQFSHRHPLHVVLRVHRSVGSLRSHEGWAAIREARTTTLRLGDRFRIVHFSIQRTHIHLIVEAKGKDALTEGMRVFTISCAKQMNAALTATSGVRRYGSVFVDRYYSRVLTSPRAVRNCLSYVLNNWRHHGVDRAPMRDPWKVDPFSSALAFDGWKEINADPTSVGVNPILHGKRFRIPTHYDGGCIWTPVCWLLTTGWRRHGLISTHEVPGRSDE